MVNSDLSIMKRFCVACGACLSACPSDAVRPALKKGVATVEIDSGKCSKCTLCSRVCPIFDYFALSDEKKSAKEPFWSLLLGNSCDEQIRNYAASGGLATALSSYLLEKGEIDGVLTVKMSGTEPLQFIAKNPSDLNEAGGSIYFPTWTLKSVELLRNSTLKVAIVGLPCQISAAKKLIKQGVLRPENVKFLFGLRCYHINSPWYMDYLLTRMLHLSKINVSQITSRRHGWQGGIDVNSESSTYHVPLVFSWKTGLGIFNPMSLDRLNAQLGCIICKDRDSLDADITFAEAWFTTGKSLIISRTERGIDLVKRAVSEGKIEVGPVQQEKLPHLVEGEDLAYVLQQQIMSDVVEHGFLVSGRKYGLVALSAVFPHLLLKSPFFRRLLLSTLPPKTLMGVIGYYSKILNNFFL
jgi:coenzyme F420 hydrogenase subunit beta